MEFKKKLDIKYIKCDYFMWSLTLTLIQQGSRRDIYLLLILNDLKHIY